VSAIDWKTPVYRMGYIWWGRHETSPWDADAVNAINQAIGSLGLSALRPDMKQWAVVTNRPGRSANVRKRPWKGRAFEAFGSAVGPETEAIYCFLSSGSLELGPPDFFAELSWTTGRQVAGTYPFRPPENRPALGFASLVIARDLLSATPGAAAFDAAVQTFAQTVGPHRGGILIDQPWDHGPEAAKVMGQIGPTGARISLLALSPRLDGANDVDTWAPSFDIPLR
jgi:hypothetical protein